MLYLWYVDCRGQSGIRPLFFYFINYHCVLLAVVCVTDTEEPLPKVRRIETEPDKDDQQLKQVSDTTALLQHELIQAADRERQLQMQLDKMKDDVSQLQMQLEQRSMELDDFKQHSARLWEQEMKQRESRSIAF